MHVSMEFYFEYDDNDGDGDNAGDHGNDMEFAEGIGAQSGQGGISQKALLIQMENMYYQCKSWKQSGQLSHALSDLDRLLSLGIEESHSDAAMTKLKEWKFRSLKQKFKLLVMTRETRAKWMDSCIKCHLELMQIRVFVSSREAERKILGLLDWVHDQVQAPEFLLKLCHQTLGQTLEKEERIHFHVHLILARLALRQGDTVKMFKETRFLKRLCKEERGTQWLEISSLEIQAYDLLRDDTNVRECYSKTLHMKSAIPHPRLLAITRQIGGKMHMRQGNAAAAAAIIIINIVIVMPV